MNSSPNISRAKINRQIRLGRDLIRIIDTGETLNLTSARLGIDTALIRLLAVLERSSDVDEIEAAILLDEFASSLARSLEGGDWGSDDGGAGTGEFAGDEGDAANVLVAVFAGETEFRA